MIAVRGCAAAGFAGPGEVPASVVFDDLPDEAQHTAYDVANDDLTGLSGRQPPADGAHAIQQLDGIVAFEFAHDLGDEGGGGDCARARVADLASLEEAVWVSVEVLGIWKGGNSYDISWSTEWSAGVDLSDLRKDVRPGASTTAGAISVFSFSFFFFSSPPSLVLLYVLSLSDSLFL